MQGLLKRAVLSSILALWSTSGHGAPIQIGEALPPLRIADLGECVIHGDETVYEPWESSRLQGKLQLVAYVAARAGIDRIHEPLYDAIRDARLPPGRFVVTKLVNADDALWGTSALVGPMVAKNKQEFPENRMVVDAEGIGLRLWGLQEKSGAIALLDRSGRVLFFKDGELTKNDIETVVRLVRETPTD